MNLKMAVKLLCICDCVKLRGAEILMMEYLLRATRCHLPHGITVLPATRQSVTSDYTLP